MTRRRRISLRAHTKVPQESPAAEAPGAQSEEQNVPQEPSELAQLGETMKDVREIMKDIQDSMRSTQDTTTESKDVLKIISRMLKLIQGQQCSVAAMDKYYHIYKNPVNKEGVSALMIDFTCRNMAYLSYGTGIINTI
ncbi:hypothetical protein RSOL_294730, partial [Rhizoctonia solani AG-3 Rhs1AP]